MSKRQRRRTEKRRRHRDLEPDRLRRSLATGAGVTVGATLLMGGAAQAACTCTVDSLLDTADPGHTTLRDAITSANQLANAYSTITFASALSGNTITLSGTELPAITNSTVIQGPSGGIMIDGDDTSRIFNVSASTVRISGVTVQNGNDDYGGGIYLQAGNLTVDHSVVTGNTASPGDGGGIYVHSGNLTVDSSTLSDNYSQHLGGGIGTNSGSALHAGTTTVRNSTLTGNDALNYGGGAYFNYQSPATVDNSTIYDNAGYSAGGGLYHAGRSGGPGLTVTGSTITHNYGLHSGGGVGGGGLTAGTQPAIRDSIVSDNTLGPSGVGADLSVGMESMDVGFSLIGDVDPDTTVNATGPNLIGVDPQLGALADNGGPTETQKPAAASPAIDAGSAFALTTDQRGLGRPFDAVTANAVGGDASDIGAVELQSSDIAAAPTPPTTTPPTTPSTPAAKKKCKKKKHKRLAESAKKKCKKKKKK